MTKKEALEIIEFHKKQNRLRQKKFRQNHTLKYHKKITESISTKRRK